MAVEFKNFDFSPFLDVKYSKATKGGALADAFEAVGQTLDAHGQNADEKLLSELSQEQDRSKVKAEAFYNPLNALNAEKIVDKNVDRYNAMDAKAREDSQYYRNEFTNQAAGDALSLSKDEWNAKYANAGGLDGVRLNNIFNQKEDRVYTKNQRIKQGKIDDWNFATSKKNQKLKESEYAAKQAERARLKAVRAKEKEQAEANKAIINNVSSKYNTWDDFRKSEDWATTPFSVKSELAKSKTFGSEKKGTVTEQIKLEKISNNKKDLERIKTEYKTKTGKDMSVSAQSKFVYDDKMPVELEEKAATPLSVKDSKDLDGLIKYQNTLNNLEKAYDSSYVGGLDSSLNTISPNFILSDGHRKFNTIMNDVTLGKTSALAGTLSDKDMALLQSSGLSETLGEKDFLEALRKNKSTVERLIRERYDTYAATNKMPKHYDYIKLKMTDKDKPEEKVKVKTITTKTPEIIKTITNAKTGEKRKWSNLRGFINE